MKDHFDKAESPLKGHSKMVDYLQNLTAEHIDVICKFAGHVFERNPSDGLSIFTDDLMEVEGWPRAKVLEHKKRPIGAVGRISSPKKKAIDAHVLTTLIVTSRGSSYHRPMRRMGHGRQKGKNGGWNR